MAQKKEKNKVVDFILTFLGVAAALTAFWIFFDWFNAAAVKKEAFEFTFMRHIIAPCVLALVYTLVMQAKVIGKSDKEK